MAVDENQLKKLSAEYGDIAHLINLEWRLKASSEWDLTDEVVRNRPLVSHSYSIEHVSTCRTYRLHGAGQTNRDGVAEVFVTDFMRDEAYEVNEPTAVTFVATADTDEPVLVTHSVEETAVDGGVADIETHYTVVVRSWALDGSPTSAPFSWHATVDATLDEAIGDG